MTRSFLADIDNSGDDAINERSGTLAAFTGERDLNIAPQDERVLHWKHFVSDFYSKDREYEEVKDICDKYYFKTIDLRPYMIE